MPPRKRNREASDSKGPVKKVIKVSSKQVSFNDNEGSFEQDIKQLHQICSNHLGPIKRKTTHSQVYSLSICLGFTQTQFFLSMISEYYKNKLSEFTKTYKLTNIEVPDLDNEYVSQEIKIQGVSPLYIGLAISVISYHIHNKTLEMTGQSRIGIKDHGLKIELLVNKYQFKGLNKITRVLNDNKYYVNVTSSSVINLEFSNLISLKLIGATDMIMLSIGEIIDVLYTDDSKPEEETKFPKKIAKYTTNPCSKHDLKNVLESLLNRSKYQLDSHPSFEDMLLGDNLLNGKTPEFLRIPYLGTFQDPDLVLKEEGLDEFEKFSKEEQIKQSSKLREYFETLRKSWLS